MNDRRREDWRGATREGTEPDVRLRIWDTDAQDPYALPLSSPLDDFERRRMGTAPLSPQPDAGGTAPPTATAPPGSPLDPFGARTAAALGAIDFPSFVSALITGTFDAIVQSSARQMAAFADLVASLATTVDDFAEQNVTTPQVHSWLAQTFPKDLAIEAPPTGSGGATKLVPTKASDGTSPSWLSRFDAAGQELTEEFTNGDLVDRARRSMAERRMQQLATLVLMGVNRVVIEHGDITAKLTFHATASQDDRMAVGLGQADGAGATGGNGFAGYSYQQPATTRLAVSTAQVNAQREASMRADLVGQVSVRFSTETFPLERFADSAAIQLINAHAKPAPAKRSGSDAPEPAPAAPAATPPAEKSP